MRKAILRQLKLFLVVLLGYLLQASLMPYIRIGGLVPSLLISVIAIVTVGYGHLHAFWTGAFYGIVMETMLPTVQMLNLLFYPVAALFCSLFFADKSAARLQYERSAGKASRNISPLLRTALCAATNALVYEIVNVAYMYLGGTDFTMAQLGKSLTGIFSTTVLTVIIMIPVRKLLGFRKPKPEDPAELRFDQRTERI